MKIKTLEDLQEKIDAEISWRKFELTDIKFDVEDTSSANKKTKERAIKYGIVLLYSHWEGAIKKIAEYYLIYVLNLKLTFGELLPNFLAIELNKDFKQLMQSKKITPYNSLIDEVFNRQDKSPNFKTEKIINAKSNLNSAIFKEIMGTIGIPTTSYESKFTFLDSKLLQNRNFIAHGERFEKMQGITNIDEYIEIHEIIVGMIDLFAQEIYDFANKKGYKKYQI
ncbi:MAE_28990/MAE_18760 family HEPN-like nuclease [Lactococcus lactis]|uniref:MAE_28990/MAE_18760 family HEPN-like nuclease n=1 Tax=Lactococcus lactis TaxID=1358 RepID=UPI0021A4B691|nr:MAE_28990/MAE_18760 family HEPN-like nuclease [Lactococcus lactis]MCT3132918.1 hypothetical protein [Lactococcus lactis]